MRRDVAVRGCGAKGGFQRPMIVMFEARFLLRRLALLAIKLRQTVSKEHCSFVVDVCAVHARAIRIGYWNAWPLPSVKSVRDKSDIRVKNRES